MNKKIIIIISVLILFISIFGLLTSNQNATNKPPEILLEPKKATYSFLVASRDLHQGEIISVSDITIESIQEDEGKDYGKTILNQTKDFIADSILLKAIKQGDFIAYSDIARPGSVAYNNLKANPKKNLFSFGFDLGKREYSILQKLKPNDFVDIYFKYETRNKKTIPVLPKKDPNQQYSNDGNASSANLILMFPNKRVLFLEKTPPIQEEKNSLPKSIAQLHIELSQEEIKKIYAIEDLGIFVLFPTAKNQKNTIATEDILTKDFIKELRGGADAKEDSY